MNQKEKAWSAVAVAVSNGRLVRPKACSNCLRGGSIQAHHEDYRKPLEVNWLCASCHKLLSNGLFKLTAVLHRDKHGFMTDNMLGLRVPPVQIARLTNLGKRMIPPMSASQIVIQMIRQELPLWERGYFRPNTVKPKSK